jgi:hypothetical protein
VCSEPNSYIVSTNCGRLFHRNRQAINLDKSLVQLRRTLAINFIEEWQSSSSVPVSTPTLLVRSRSNSVSLTVSELGDPEDFMLAFYGFEMAGIRPLLTRGRPRRSQSTGVNPVWSESQGLRSSSLEHSNVRVTRSGRVYGARHLH